MTSPLTLVCLISFSVAVYADYSVAASPPQASVVQYPVAAPPVYNQPGYVNVAPGYHHGAFFDGLASKRRHRGHRHHKKSRKHHKKSRRSSSSSGSWSASREHHHGIYGGQYPGYWPGVYQDQVLSNPFYVPEERHHRRRHRKHRRHGKRSSSSSRKSDSSSSGDHS